MNEDIRRAWIGCRVWPLTEPTLLNHLIQTGVLVSMKPYVSHGTETQTVLVKTQWP